MEIKGHVYCFFEQSGVFKNEFKKLGYDASDWDIQNNFGETDGTFTNADDKNMPNKCSIQRDIVTRMACDEPINERTIKVCDNFILHGILCPYMKTERKKYPKKDKQQTTLEL